MAKKRQINIQYPLGGLDRKASYRQQKPYTTPDALNVRASGVIEGRDRGGSRPGLMQSHEDDLGSNVRMLFPMIVAPNDGFTAFSDTFGGTAIAAAWTQASWATDVPSILPSALLSVDTSVADAAIVHDALLIDSSQNYTVEMMMVPWNGEFHGKYQLYLRMDNTLAYATEGVEVEIIMSGDTGAYTGTLKSYLAAAETSYALTAGTIVGGARPVWLTVSVATDTITVKLDGVTLIVQDLSPAQNGLRVGLGLECTVDGGLCLANVFRVQYYSTQDPPSLRSMLVASCGGAIYRETPYGRMTVVPSDLSVRDDVQLMAAQSGQKLYIADYGDVMATGTNGVVSGATLDSATYANWTLLEADGLNVYDYVVVISNGTDETVDGTYQIESIAIGAITLTAAPGDGNCSFRIERGPKIYDPIENTLTLFTAEAGGQVPTGCPLIVNYLDRIVLSGAEIAPHVWYAARKSDEDDWDYSQTDSTRAVAGPLSEAGMPGEATVALSVHSDDYLILAGRNTLWRMRGDPVYGGSLDSVSQKTGMVGPSAWCFGPSGEIIFLSKDGIYILPPGDSQPISMSREVLPSEFLNFHPDTTTVLMEYDVDARGIHIYLTSDSYDTRTHWWFDWESKTFWPVTLSSDHEPTAICSYQATAIEDTGIILGCKDGKLRRYTHLAETDCGTAFATYVKIGPIALGPDSFVGIIESIDAVMAANSADVTWSIYPSLTFEGAASSTSTNFTGTWIAGLNSTTRMVGRGQAFMLKITGTSGRRWAMESITGIIKQAGPRRKA